MERSTPSKRTHADPASTPKSFLVKFASLSPILAFLLISTLQLGFFIKNSNSYSDLDVITDYNSNGPCRIRFLEKLMGSDSDPSNANLASFQKTFLSKGSLFIISLSELVCIVLFTLFFMDSTTKNLHYVLVALIAGKSERMREIVTGALSNSFFRFLMVYFCFFTNNGSALLLEILKINERETCITSALIDNPLDGALLVLYTISSVFRVLFATFVIISILLMPLFSKRKPYSSSEEELKAINTFFAEDLRPLIKEKIYFCTIETQTEHFEFQIRPREDIRVFFFGSSRLVVINLSDSTVIKNKAFDFAKNFEFQYNMAEPAVSRLRRIFSMFQFCLFSILAASAAISGILIFFVVMIFHKSWLVTWALVISASLPLIGSSLIYSSSIWKTFHSIKSQVANMSGKESNKVCNGRLQKYDASHYPILSLRNDDFENDTRLGKESLSLLPGSMASIQSPENNTNSVIKPLKLLKALKQFYKVKGNERSNWLGVNRGKAGQPSMSHFKSENARDSSEGQSQELSESHNDDSEKRNSGMSDFPNEQEINLNAFSHFKTPLGGNRINHLSSDKEESTDAKSISVNPTGGHMLNKSLSKSSSRQDSTDN
jgi:hypothetical protein